MAMPKATALGTVRWLLATMVEASVVVAFVSLVSLEATARARNVASKNRKKRAISDDELAALGQLERRNGWQITARNDRFAGPKRPIRAS